MKHTADEDSLGIVDWVCVCPVIFRDTYVFLLLSLQGCTLSDVRKPLGE